MFTSHLDFIDISNMLIKCCGTAHHYSEKFTLEILEGAREEFGTMKVGGLNRST